MIRIIIKDLPEGVKIPPDEMKNILGGLRFYSQPYRLGGFVPPRTFGFLGPQPEPPDKPDPTRF